MVRLAVAGVAAAALAGGTYGPYVWPTSVAVAPGGTVLVVENGAGRLLRVDPATQKVATLAAGLVKPFAVAVSPAGTVYVSANGRLLVVSGGRTRPVAGAGTGVAPIAVSHDGGVAYATASTAVLLRDGRAHVVARGLGVPHGITFAADGSLLVSDTGHDRVVRVRSGRVTTLLRVAQPRGLAVASDGTIYVAEGVSKRVGRYSATGRRLGSAGPRFGDPYAVAVAGTSLYVVDTAAVGFVRRVAR